MDHLECNMDMESRKQEYYRTRDAAKIFKTKNAERTKFCEGLEGEDGRLPLRPCFLSECCWC